MTAIFNENIEPGRRAATPFSAEMAVAQVARAWQLRLTERLTPLGLTAAQWRALGAIARSSQGLGQGALAAEIGVEEPGVVRLVDALEAAGRVTRRVSPTDRRSRIVQTTAMADAIIEAAMRINAALESELFEGLPPEDINICAWVLRRLLYRLQSLRPLPRPSGEP